MRKGKDFSLKDGQREDMGGMYKNEALYAD